jgi:hypothetical protein
VTPKYAKEIAANLERAEQSMQNKRTYILLASFLLLAVALACGGIIAPTPTFTPPTVTITFPTNGYTTPVGQEIAVQSIAMDVRGVLRVELWVDGSPIRVDASSNPRGQSPFVASQPWVPQAPGSHTLVAKAYNMAAQVAESPPVVVNVTAGSTGLVETPATAPTPSVPRTATPTPPGPPQVPPTWTPTSIPIPQVPPTWTPTATPTPPPPATQPVAETEPTGRFKQVWDSLGGATGRLGYALGDAVDGRAYARQFFERGYMYWWSKGPEGGGYIWVIEAHDPGEDRGNFWARFDDAWHEGMDEYSCDEAQVHAPVGPKRGFGKVWCEHPEVRDMVGQAREEERGNNSSSVQFFQGGVMLYSPLDQRILVLFNQGGWQNFPGG